MWSAQDRCSLALEAANSLVAPLDESATWTDEDSRRFVAMLQDLGKIQPIRAAWTELINARQAYRTAALSTAKLANDIFLAGPDMAVIDALHLQNFSSRDEERLIGEALAMSHCRNLDHFRSLTREMVEISRLYGQRSRPFIERYGPLCAESADATGSFAGDGGPQTAAAEA